MILLLSAGSTSSCLLTVGLNVSILGFEGECLFCLSSSRFILNLGTGFFIIDGFTEVGLSY